MGESPAAKELYQFQMRFFLLRWSGFALQYQLSFAKVLGLRGLRLQWRLSLLGQPLFGKVLPGISTSIPLAQYGLPSLHTYLQGCWPSPLFHYPIFMSQTFYLDLFERPRTKCNPKVAEGPNFPSLK